MMYMSAQGRLRIGNNLFTGPPPVPENVVNNRFEITASPIDPYFNAVGSPTPNPNWGPGATIGGCSGLRFTHLRSYDFVQLPTVANGINPRNVLTTDRNGDVVMINIPVVGNLCTVTNTNNLNGLTGDFRIPTNTFIYRFVGQGVINNAIKRDIVSVGYSCGINPPSRFSVLESQSVQPQSDQTYAGHFSNVNISSSIFNSGFVLENAGIYANAIGSPSTSPNIYQQNTGGIFEAYNVINAVGVMGRIGKGSVVQTAANSPHGLVPRYAIGGAFMSDTNQTNPTTGLPVKNFGVYARAINSPIDNIGVYAEVNKTGVGSNIAVLAISQSPNNFPNFPGNYAGYFDGDVVKTGSDNFTSDLILKQNLDSIPNALGIINQLKPKTFDYKISQYPQMCLPAGLQYGLVAQDVQTVVPAIVNTARHPERTIANTVYPAFTYSTVEYTQLIPVLIRAVQQLSAQNHKLDSMVTALTQTVSACCSNSAAKETGINGSDPKDLTQINITLTDEDVVILDQNKPNPFAEQTTITYNVPLKYGYAQLVFKTVDGRILKTVDITKKGRGQVNVFANDLTNGLYMYSLIVDGVTVDTKKMIKQN